MQSRVRDVLLCEADATGDEELWKFVKDKCKLSLTKVEKEEFIEHPEYYIDDKELCNRIVSLPAYKVLKTARHLEETADYLESLGIIYLHQWKDYANRDTLLIIAHAKGLLDSALAGVSQVLPQGQLVKHFYDTVSSAQWHYIEMDPNSGGIGMRVKEGLPEELWSDAEVNNYQEYEGQKIQGQPYIEAPQVPLMVLSSKGGWPYTYFEETDDNVCFVRREMVRVWRIIQQDITKWVEGGCTPKSATSRILIGTPGIGKSFGGSYLLYELLKCDVQTVPVVAYFVHDMVYVFDRTSNPPHVHYFRKETEAVRFVNEMQTRYNGYIIYDVSKKMRDPPPKLYRSWCSLVISSPNKDNFSEWEKQRGAERTIINCPTTVELKAMCAWMKRDQPADLPEYWADIEKRVSNVGPIPRFIFDVGAYSKRCDAIELVLGEINSETVVQYYRMGVEGLWRSDKVSHKIVKITREKHKYGSEEFFNEPICPNAKGKIGKAVSKAINTDAAQMAVLLPLKELIPRVLETFGVRAFMEKNFVKRILPKLTVFLPEKSERSGKPCVLCESIEACPDDSISVPLKSAVTTKTDVRFKMLYIPTSDTFPVLDGFFFVENPRKTIVGIQVTKSENHDTTTSKVKALREYLAAFFVDGDRFPTDLSWEIIYVQHTDSVPMKRWQECSNNFYELKTGNMSYEEHDAIATHWNKKVHQYHLIISSEDVRDNK